MSHTRSQQNMQQSRVSQQFADNRVRDHENLMILLEGISFTSHFKFSHSVDMFVEDERKVVKMAKTLWKIIWMIMMLIRFMSSSLKSRADSSICSLTCQ